jgi:hypothetical protein
MKSTSTWVFGILSLLVAVYATVEWLRGAAGQSTVLEPDQLRYLYIPLGGFVILQLLRSMYPEAFNKRRK